jgi:hypothetical protein
MRLLSALPVSAIVLVLAAAAPAAPRAPKRAHHVIRGVVEAVHKDRDKDSGTIVVVVHHPRLHGRQAAGPRAAHRRAGVHVVHVRPLTRFVRLVSTGKGIRRAEPASFRDIHRGEHVLIVPAGDKHDDARAVTILVGHHHARALAAMRPSRPLPARRKKPRV